MARAVFADAVLAAKLRNRIKQALSKRKTALSPEVFFRPELPEASIVTPGSCTGSQSILIV